MFRSVLVMYICCVGLSVAQDFSLVKDYQDVPLSDTEEPQVVNDTICPLHEQWTNCANGGCRKELCSEIGLPVFCPTVSACVPGCLCIDGYLRDESGLCVPEGNCTTNSKCPLYEQWSYCANGVCSAKLCTQKGHPAPCPSISECVPGCLCEYNYLRDESGLCVPEEDCTANTTCLLHEQWSDCANAECRAEYCSQRGLSDRCPTIYKCEPGCLCQENYFRDESGICVPEEDCPNTCGRNEVFECVNPCPFIQTCEDRALNITCSTNQQCDYLCVCKEGCFRRFEGGECIPEIECGPRACGDNERYTHCKPSCSNDTCSSLASLRSCENQDPCKAGCTCRDGYYREEEDSPCKPLCLCSEAQETHDCSAWSTQYEQEKRRREGN